MLGSNCNTTIYIFNTPKGPMLIISTEQSWATANNQTFHHSAYLQTNGIGEEHLAGAIVVSVDGGQSRTQHLPTCHQGVVQEVKVHLQQGGGGLDGEVQEVGHFHQHIVELFSRRT